MANLFIITGPAGVGKSTISSLLANSVEKSVLIEGDEIYSQVKNGYISPWKDGNHLDVFWKVVFNMIKTYLENDYNVIFNYIVTPQILENFSTFFESYSKKFVVLLSDESVLLSRDNQRPVDYQMHERCLVLLESFKSKNFDSKFILDTSNLSVSETVDIIENNLDFQF